MFDLKLICEDIRNIIEDRKKEICLDFIEKDHIYYMKDFDGEVKTTFPSVSKVIKKFYKDFDSEGISYSMAKGNEIKQKRILAEWKNSADYSINIGSRTHFILEKESLKMFGLEKEVRKPEFDCDLEQTIKSDAMIKGGLRFLNLMKERGAVLLDTEMILGDPELGYVGTPDKIWLIENQDKTEFGIVCTDYKTNKPKSFKKKSYTDNMFPPFDDYPNNALGHYYVQLPLYMRLFLKMLKDSKYANIKLYGCILAHLLDDASFNEYRVPKDVIDKTFKLDIKKHLK